MPGFCADCKWRSRDVKPNRRQVCTRKFPKEFEVDNSDGCYDWFPRFPLHGRAYVWNEQDVVVLDIAGDIVFKDGCVYVECGRKMVGPDELMLTASRDVDMVCQYCGKVSRDAALIDRPRGAASMVED